MKRLVTISFLLAGFAGRVLATETWREPNLAYRQAFNVTKAGGSVTGFPVAIVLNAIYFKIPKAKMLTGCWEVWDSDGVHWYGEEVSLTDDGTYVIAELHVSDSTYNMSSGKELWLYYGTKASGSSRVGATGSANGKLVWDANFAGVWHMGDAEGTSVVDSTGNIAGTRTDKTHPASYASGQIGGALDFDGASAFVSISPSSADGTYTFSGWFYADAIGGGDYVFDSKTGRLVFATEGAAGYIDTYDSGAAWRLAEAKVVMATGQWDHIAWVVDGGASTSAAYRNGASVATGSYAKTSIGGTTGIGARYSGASYLFDGRADEVRLSYGIARSLDWETTEQANGAAGNGLTLDGSEESAPSGYFGWPYPILDPNAGGHQNAP